jgi:hypothetical protein
MSPATIARRRLLAALVLGGSAAVAFTVGVKAGDGAPAKAELEFQQADQTVIDSGAGASDLQPPWRKAVASRFDDYGLPLACGGVLEPDEQGVASRTLPCGTLVTFFYRGRSVEVPVIDRGPYVDGRAWDFTGATAEALGFPGLGTVAWHL